MNNQKPLFADLIIKRRSFLGLTVKRVVVFIGCLVFFIAGSFVFKHFVFENNQPKDRFKSPPKTQIQRMVVKIRNLEKEVSKKQNDVLKLMLKYKEKTGKELSYFNLLNLNDREKELVENIIKEERQISIKTLLGTILERTLQISDLKKRVTDIKEKLPDPKVVTKGQNHYQIALNYLIKELGLSQGEAIKILEKSVLFEHLIPGFKVWNFYNKGEFGTFVTQGEALISPGQLQQMAKQKMILQKKQMIAERSQLTKDIASLKISKRGLSNQLKNLDQTHAQLTVQYSDLTAQYKDLDKKWNSLFYRLDLKKRLVKQGIIKRGFLRNPTLNQFAKSDFQNSIDLRSSKKIKVPAAWFNTKKIKHMVIYPRFYKKGVDYDVSMDEQGSEVVLTILNPEKLKNEHVVISVE